MPKKFPKLLTCQTCNNHGLLIFPSKELKANVHSKQFALYYVGSALKRGVISEKEAEKLKENITNSSLPEMPTSERKNKICMKLENCYRRFHYIFKR